MKERKKPEPKPAGRFFVSMSGVCGRLRRTSRTRGGLWLYRLDYGDVVGSAEWTLDELQATSGSYRIRPTRKWRLLDEARTARRDAAAAAREDLL